MRIFYYVYFIIRFLVLLILSVSSLLFIGLESPQLTLALLKNPLQTQGIYYKKVQGNSFSGFEVLDVNYQDKLLADKIAYKIDLKALEKGVLYVNHLEVEALEIEEEFLKSLTQVKANENTDQESNLTLPFKQVIVDEGLFSIHNIHYDVYCVNKASLRLKHLKSNLLNQHEGVLNFNLDSNVSRIDLNASMKNNYYELQGNVRSEDVFINSLLKPFELEFKKSPIVHISAKGDMNESNLSCQFENVSLSHNEMWSDIHQSKLKAQVQHQQGDIEVKLLTLFDSFIAKGELESNTMFNYHDINKTLETDINSKLRVKPTYINKLLQESETQLSGKTPIEISGSGTLEKLKLKFDGETSIKSHGVASRINFYTDSLIIGLNKHFVDGNFFVDAEGERIRFKLNSYVTGDYLKPNALKIKSKLALLKFNAFEIDLSSLVPMDIKIDKNKQTLHASVMSDRMQMSTKSFDLDRFEFDFVADQLYLSKIIELPKGVTEDYLNLDFQGTSRISKMFLDAQGLVRTKENLSLKMDIQNNSQGLNIRASTGTLSFVLDGDIDTRDIKADIELESLKKLQKELQQFYDFESVPVDGKVNLSMHLQDEVANVNFTSNALYFDEVILKKVALEGNHEEGIIKLKDFSLNVYDKDEKSLLQKFYLMRPATFNWSERRDIDLQMYPNISLQSMGTKNDFKATLQVEAIRLQHPLYGNTELTCDIDYHESNQTKKILGGVFLDKLNLLYESKFLDPSYDRDVIIIKNNKDKKEDSNDSALDDMEIDLQVYAGDAKYKTSNIGLSFLMNVKVKKELEESLRLLGKLEEIEGEVEQNGKIFEVIDSSVVFRGAKEVNPLLDIEVQYQLPDIDITIDIQGNAKRPRLSFSSDPSMPKKDILSYLLLGVSASNLQEREGSLSKGAELFILNQAARDLAQEVELDRLRLKDDGTEEGYNLEVGKKIQEETMLIIEKNKEGNSFILEYDLNENMKIEVGQHQKAVPSQSIDFYYRNKFK